MNHYRVETYGAKGDGKTDDGLAFERLLDAVRQQGGDSVIDLAPGKTYRIVGATRHQWPQDGSISYVLDLPSHTKLLGNGAELLLAPDRRAVWLVGVDDVAVCDVDIDYSPLPFAQGTVKTIRDITTIDVEIDQEYAAQEFALLAMSDPPPNPPFFGKVKLVDGTFVNIYIFRILPTDPHTVRVTAIDDKQFSGLVTGGNERVVLPVFTVGQRDPDTFHVYNSAGVTFQNVRLFSAPLMATAVRQNIGPVSFLGVKIMTRPGTNRLISSWRDAFHVTDNRAPALFDSCYIDSPQDDGFNVCSLWSTITKVVPDQENVIEIALTGDTLLPEKGDTLELCAADGGVLGTVTVTSSDTATCRLGLARDIPGLAVGQRVISINASNPGTTIRNTRIVGTSLRLRSPGITFEGNDVDGGLTWIYADDVEGPVPRDVILRGNTFNHNHNAMPSVACQGAQPSHYDVIVGNNGSQAGRNIRNIVFQGNRFAHAVDASDTQGLVFESNDFLTDSAATWLDLVNDGDVKVWGTLNYGEPFANMADKSLVCPGNMQVADVVFWEGARDSPAVFPTNAAANKKAIYVVTTDGRLAQISDTDGWTLNFPAEEAGQGALRFQGAPAVFPTNAAANKKAIYVVTTDGRLAQISDTDRWTVDFPAEEAGQAALQFQGAPAVFPTNAAANKKAIYVVTTDGRLAQLSDTDRWTVDFPAEEAGQTALQFQGAPAVFPTNAAANKKAIYVVTIDGRLAQLSDTDRWTVDFPAEEAGQAALQFKGTPAVFPTDAAANKKSIYVVTTDGRLAEISDSDAWTLDFPAEEAGQAALRFQGASAVFPTNAAANKKSIYVVTTGGRLAEISDSDGWTLDFPAEAALSAG
jgi:hypothetical protein